MSSLEDLLPEMAGVFAAQESALENCVAVLSTQLENLGADVSRQVHRVATLESTQRGLLATIAALEDQTTALQSHIATLEHQNELLVQHQSTQSGELVALRELAAKVPTVDFSSFKDSLSQEMEAQTTAVVQAIVTEQITATETKITQLMNERMLEASNRAFLQAQQSEETFQAQLEMLEKKFDFLSKVKMDIKDIGKRMDKQDQTLDDMRTGLALLAKSIGSDEIDDEDESDHHAESENSGRRKPSLVADAPMLVMPMTVTMGTPIEEEEQTVGQEEKEPPLEAQPTDTPPMPPAEETKQEPVALAGEDMIADEPTIEQAETVEVIAATPSEATAPPVVEPLEEKADDQTDVDVAEVHEPQHEEEVQVIVEPQPEETSTSNDEPEVIVPAPQPESETPPPSEIPHEEQAVESVANIEAPEQPPSRQATPPEPVVEPRAEPAPAPAKPPTPMSIGESDDESEDKDEFMSVPLMALQNAHPQLQHMPTAPSLSTVAYIRSRRQERSAKRGSRRESSLDLQVPDSTRAQRIPLSRDEIKGLWMRIFNKIVQLKRLQSINGTSPERTLFRKQNISMGARVKRLEETSVDLEDTIEFLETNIQTHGMTLQALNQAVTQSSTTLEKKTRKLDELQRMQGQSIAGIEEKFEAFEAEFRRMRNVARRDSTQSSATATAMTQIASEMHNVTARLIDQTRYVEDHEAKLHQLLQSDLPNLTANVQSALLELRTEVDFKTRELAKDLCKAVENLRAGQAASHAKLENQLVGYTDSLYRDLLVLTSAILVAAELAAKQSSSKANTSPTRQAKQKSPLDISVTLLHSVLGTFESDCRRVLASDSAGTEMSDTGALVSVLFDKLQNFRHDLTKLKDQAEKATAITSTSDTDTSSRSKGFEDHLVLICTNQLRMLEEILVSQSRQEPDINNPEEGREETALILAHVKDLVIQLRAVLFLLVLHAQLVEPPRQIKILQNTHSSMDIKLTAHEFALSQLASVEAVVKMMNSRLDSFMDMSFSFAKDADVKKSIQEMLNASDELREQLVKQVDATHGDAVKRDELMERELLQLAGRVQKKLDKDEMLWTQEVLERQLQNVAKGALGEQDLMDIQRALRTKMDKTQFHALLQQQHAKLQELGLGNGTLSLYGGGSGGNQPLAATRCISCDGELPPSASQMREAVREEVQQEVAKALAAAKHHAPVGASSSSSSSGFNASSHRSMDKHKRELLMAALQQQQRK